MCTAATALDVCGQLIGAAAWQLDANNTGVDTPPSVRPIAARQQSILQPRCVAGKSSVMEAHGERAPTSLRFLQLKDAFKRMSTVGADCTDEQVPAPRAQGGAGAVD
jgi:hypothetical protein